jgi:cytochrome o ubiquinol oxidase operon protein cyoD
MKATLKSYIIGFAASLALTLTAAALVWIHANSGHLTFTQPVLYGIVIALALVQLIVQLVFFMHLGEEKGPRWRLGVFVSTFGIIVIIVAGAIWIMGHLNYDMMASPQQMDAYIQSQDGL